MDVRTPLDALVLPKRVPLDAAVSTPGDQEKEVARDASEEEVRSQADQDGTAPQSAEARRGRRRQERLTALIAPWWEADPALLAAEISALAAAGFAFFDQGLAPGHNLRLELTHEANRYELIFEDNYPGGGFVAARRHDPLRGEPRGAIELESGPAGALEAVERLRGVQPSLEAARGGRMLLPRAWNDAQLSRGDHGTLTFGVAPSGKAFVPLTITGVVPPEAQRLAEESRGFAQAFPRTSAGLWVCASAADNAPSVEVTVAGVEEQLAIAHNIPIPTVRARLRGELGALFAPGRLWESWQFVRRGAAGEAMAVRTIPYTQSWWFDRAPYARAIADRRVAIIGCGAVGWAVAVMLARSGVRRFVLYDADEIHNGNLARLGASLSEAGLYKVEALEAQLVAISPDVEVARHVVSVGRHIGAQGLVDDDPDLLINLTGEEISTDETNLAALFLDRPAIFAWVSNGIAAGRIFRVRPQRSACYECVRDASPEPIPSWGRIPVGDAAPWLGSIIDVETFAAAVAQMAVRTLRDLSPSQANPDHLVLTFDRLMPRAKRIEIARRRACSRCRP